MSDDDPREQYPPGTWLTVCDGCRDWVPGIFYVTQDGKRLCYDCTPPAERGEEEKKFVPVGPPAPPDSPCPCGAAAVAACDGCGGAFCGPCWHRHSHTAVIQSADELPVAVAARTGAPLDGEALRRSVAFAEAWQWAWLGMRKWKRLDEPPCPVCGAAETCTASPDRVFVRCTNVESDRAPTAADDTGRRGWLHLFPKARARRKSA